MRPTELIERLGECDALAFEAEREREDSAPTTPPPIEALAAAILGDAAPAADGPWRLIATAEELVAVPVDLDRRCWNSAARPARRASARSSAGAPTASVSPPGAQPFAAIGRHPAPCTRRSRDSPSATPPRSICSTCARAASCRWSPSASAGSAPRAEHRLGTVLRQACSTTGSSASHLGIHVGIVDYALPDVSVPEYAGAIAPGQRARAPTATPPC